MEDVKVTRLINGPEAFTPDNEFCLGETERARPVRRRRLLRPRPRGRRRDRQGDGRVDHRRRAGARRLGDGHPPLRCRSTAHRATRSRARRRSTRPTTTSAIRATSARPGRPLRTSSAYAWHAAARRGVRREVRLGAGQLVSRATPRRATRRCARGAGPGCTGRRRSVPRRSPPASEPGCSTSPRLPSSRSAVRVQRSCCKRLCDNDVARDVGAITYTQMLNRRGGIECDFTVTACGRTAVPDRHRNRVRQSRRELDPPSPAARRLCRA